jgi:hypothetical protein
MENRSGLIVDARLTRVSSHAERLAALDMVQAFADRPVAITLGADNSYDAADWAEIAFGAVTAGGQLEYSRTIVFFRFNGFDEGDQISGNGSAELQGDGTFEIELSFDNGDDVTLIARRA